MHSTLAPLVCAFSLVTAGVAQKAEAAATEILIDFEAADGTPLSAKLWLPTDRKDQVPVVFFLHGAGARTYDSPFLYADAAGKPQIGSYLAFHARELRQRGIALFSISKRGCRPTAELPGMSVDREVFGKATLGMLLDDYASALDVLRARPEIDRQRIVLMGSSEGTRLAPMLARRSPAGIAGVAMMAYAADNARETVEWQNTIGPWRNVQHMVPAARDGELTKDEYDEFAKAHPAEARALPFAAFDKNQDDKLDADDLQQTLAPRLAAILAAVEERDDDFLWKYLARLSSGYLLDWWEAEPNQDILLGLDVPLAIFHGGLDGTCRIEGVRETEAAFRDRGRDNLTVFVYPDGDHDLDWTAETSKDAGPPAYRDAFAWVAGIAGDTPTWRPLFNGKDLSGWTPKIKGYALGDNHADTFRVENGLLSVRYDGYENFDNRFGHLFCDRPFANYRLRVEYRFVGEQCPGGPGWAFRNSGVMVHGQSAASMARDQDFPASIEVQLLGGRAEGDRTTANLCTPGTHVVLAGELCKRHCTDSTSATYRGDQWVTVEIEVRDNHIRHIIDGVTVLEYTDPQLDDSDADARKLLAAGQPLMLRGGTISLQSESHPIDFRKVEIVELESAGSGWTDLLAGNDLAKHWRTDGNWTIDADGVVTLTPRPGETGWARFGAYLWSTEQYDDFEIEFDYRLEKRGNSGFYFHVGDQASPVQHGIEVQIFDSHDNAGRLTDHDSGGIIPGIPPSANSARAAGEWNRFHITCKGRTLTVSLNDKVVNEVDLDRPELAARPARGAIGFQDHGLPLALRRIRIRTPR